MNVRKYKISGPEKAIAEWLHTQGIGFKTQYHIQGIPFWYDFYLPDRNLLIEFQGDYWHANPRKYPSGTLMKFWHQKPRLVEEIWRLDAEKQRAADGAGFKISHIWEMDFKRKGLEVVMGGIGMNKIVLLDIDGVLNTDVWRYAVEERHPDVRCWNPEIGLEMLDPVRVARVQSICDTTGASIVIVSGWRRWAKAEDIASVLREKGLTAPVLGAVGGLKMSGDLRADATRDWLRQHPEVTHYAVVDDDWHLWCGLPKIEHHMVQPQDGIEDEHVEKAIRILNEVPRG